MSADRPLTRDDIAALLASALGQDKSEEVVAFAARTAGVTRTEYAADDIRGIFDVLVKAEGLVGVVARFAVSRGDVEKLIARRPRKSSRAKAARAAVRPGAPDAVSPQSLPPSVAIDIMHLIVPALGAERSRAAIEQAAARRGIDLSAGLTHSGALAILDEMTNVEGIVGVVARFAKARFLLNPRG